MKLKLRVASEVNIGMTYSAKILGGGRGFGDACAFETFSNKVFPSLAIDTQRLKYVAYYETEHGDEGEREECCGSCAGR